MNTKLLSKLAIGSLATVGILASAETASAENNLVLTQTVQYLPGPPDFPDTGSFNMTPWGPITLSLDQYDPADLAPNEKLSRVEIDFGAGVQTEFTFTNDNPDQSGTVLMAVGSAIVTFMNDPLGESVVAQSSSFGPATLPGGETISSGLLEGNDFESLVFDKTVDDQNFINDLFLGTGTIDWVTDAMGASTVTTAGGNITFEQVTDAGAYIEIRYFTHTDDTTTPEPGSLLGLGLIGGLGLLAKSKKS